MSSAIQRSQRRGSSRFAAFLPAQVFHDGTSHPCEAGNLSRGGAMLAGDLPRPASRRIRVEIRTVGGDLRLDTSARVAHVETDEDGSTVIGIRFDALSDEQVGLLERLVSRVIEGRAPAAFDSLGPGASPVELRKALEKTALPHRIALAARAMFRERAILVNDSSPQVLEALSRNPNLSLLETKTLARSCKLLPTTLEILAADPRWARDEELTVLLATHPRVSLQLAEKLIGKMNDVSLGRVLQRSGLPLEIKAQLMDPILRRKLLGR